MQPGDVPVTYAGYSGIRKRLLAIIRQRIFVQGLGRLQGGIRSFMGLDLTWEIE